MVTLNDLLLMINALSCAVTAAVLGTYQRNGAPHKRLAACYALVLIIACGSVTILIATGYCAVANPAETVINLALCVAVINARGNVMKIFRMIGREEDKDRL